MSRYNTLIAVLGWEDRFYKGIESDLGHYKLDQLLLIRYVECNHLTDESRVKVEELCSTKGVSVQYIEITDKDTVSTWKKLDVFFSNSENFGERVLIEMSTMPRDTIWSLLSFLTNIKSSVDYVYYTPQNYSRDWLSREPGKPRLLFKHSGISRLGKQTALIILTGFEIERTKQLVYFFEPKKTILGLQVGNQFDNKARNIAIHESIKGYTETDEFELDAYSEDNGFNAINAQVEKLKDNFNIIITSLGPKPTAVAIYKTFLQHPEIALSYVPAKEFNPNYSEGIDKRIFGTFQ